MADTNKWTDTRMESFIGNLLRGGVLLSASIVLVGAAVYLARRGHLSAEYHTFHGEPADLRSVKGILHDAFALQGRGIIQLGLLLLIATPVARVAFSIFGFAVEKDRTYVVVTIIVLVVLLYSLIGYNSE